MYDPANHLKFWFQADHIFMDLLEDQLVEIIQFLVIFKWKLLRILLNNIRGSQICLQNLKRLNRLVGMLMIFKNIDIIDISIKKKYQYWYKYQNIKTINIDKNITKITIFISKLIIKKMIIHLQES